jgi:hypothetical protein
VPQQQKSKGSLIITAALELSRNQVTHFYSDKKNTQEMIKMTDLRVPSIATARPSTSHGMQPHGTFPTIWQCMSNCQTEK